MQNDQLPKAVEKHTKKDDATMWFAEQIKKARYNLRENQTQFAKRFGVATNSISRYETGLYQAPYEIILWCLMENNELQDDVPTSVQHANEAVKQLSKTIESLTQALATQERELLEWVRTEVIGEDEKIGLPTTQKAEQTAWEKKQRNKLRAAQRRELGERENAK